MGKCEAGGSIPYAEITICGNCYHKDVCDNKDYLTENQCYDFVDARTLVKLPCAVGDKLYETRSCFSNLVEPRELEVEGFNIWRDDALCVLCRGGYKVKVDKLGKTVFLSREEAEKALKENNHD